MSDEARPDWRRGLIPKIIAEPKQLRRLPGPLDETKVVHQTQYLLKGLGGDVAGDAVDRLTLLQERHKDDLEIVVAFTSLGMGVDRGNVLDRLTEFETRHDVDARTVRRWSDAGIGMHRPQLLVDGAAIDLFYRRVEMGLPKKPRFCCDPVRVPVDSADRVELVLRWPGEILATPIFESRRMGDWRTHCQLRMHYLAVAVYRDGPLLSAGESIHELNKPRPVVTEYDGREVGR
ncbi:hypothetical protein [Actinokineospora diospyrosa]|uniref:Alkylmercury lyase-like protein n=1 Tax=Actinokineospora diospyrosa TaxID=103728 RepID=A0ABT1IJ56_9PSEU|nr:hypothetical protein [Actinokineospora diospyrosa]MCP2272692.1 hypothetical protein [Actinokineospora diospyrosa]